MTEQRIGVAVVGAGYWGPNLIRNFRSHDAWELVAVCDQDLERADRVVRDRPDIARVASIDEVLQRDDVEAIAIATPARTHEPIALAALEAGKHVLVEKPLADCTTAGQRMVDLAAERGRVLMADHTYCYTPAVLKIRELIEDDVLGEILFIDSVRINLGLIQPDVDVFWDLAPHDLSVFDFILGGLNPQGVAAHGSDPLQTGKSCVGYLTLPLQEGLTAHVHVNWLSPTKIRQMVIGGAKRTLVWDDLNPYQRVSVYDRGVDMVRPPMDPSERRAAGINYRLGDTWAPALPEHEALSAMVEEFAASIRTGNPPRTDGRAGLRVLSVLEAAQQSLADSGRMVTPSLEPR